MGEQKGVAMKYRDRTAMSWALRGVGLALFLVLLGCQTKQATYLDSMDSQIDCVRDPECQSHMDHGH